MLGRNNARKTERNSYRDTDRVRRQQPRLTFDFSRR